MKLRYVYWAIFPALALLFAVGLGMRRTVLEAQTTAFGPDIPFTLESALHFRRVAEVYDTGGLREVDPDLEVPDGVEVAKTYTVGSEYVYAALARLFPAGMELAHRVRWIEVSWFCLGIPLVALWIGWRFSSLVGAGLSGAYYAVSLSSVIRSTGQELSRENFALPLLAGHLAFDALSDRQGSEARRRGATAASCAFLGLALMGWDLMQYYVLLWMVWSYARMVRSGPVLTRHQRAKWTAHFGTLILCGFLSPYLRSHGFVFSPTMLLGYGVLAGLGCQVAAGWRGDGARRLPRRGVDWVAGAVGLGPLGLGLLVPTRYAEHYGHFQELLLAKLRFLNQKPLDPSLLSFNERIMWVPALHSATWDSAFTLFPSILVLTIIGVAVLSWCPGRLSSPRLTQLLFFYITSLFAFFLFFRFHVFLAIFAAGVLGAWGAWGMTRGVRIRWLVFGGLLVGCAVEAAHVLNRPLRWGRSGAHYEELSELVEWSRRLEGPVLADFGLSASLLTYANTPVILHPKFESETIRNRVQTYAETLSTRPERDLRDWADRLGAEYYVYSIGQLAEQGVRFQVRYFADALEPPNDAAVRLLERTPDQARYFRPLWENRRYRVFDILTTDEAAQAHALVKEAREAFEKGALTLAEESVNSALTVDPYHPEALRLLAHIDALREKGFRYRPDAPE